MNDTLHKFTHILYHIIHNTYLLCFVVHQAQHVQNLGPVALPKAITAGRPQHVETGSATYDDSGRPPLALRICCGTCTRQRHIIAYWLCSARYCTTTGPAQPRLWTRLHRLCLYFKLRCRCLLALELRRVESSNRAHAAVHHAKAKRFQCNQEQHSKLVVGFRLNFFWNIFWLDWLIS